MRFKGMFVVGIIGEKNNFNTCLCLLARSHFDSIDIEYVIYIEIEEYQTERVGVGLGVLMSGHFPNPRVRDAMSFQHVAS